MMCIGHMSARDSSSGDDDLTGSEIGRRFSPVVMQRSSLEDDDTEADHTMPAEFRISSYVSKSFWRALRRRSEIIKSSNRGRKNNPLCPLTATMEMIMRRITMFSMIRTSCTAREFRVRSVIDVFERDWGRNLVFGDEEEPEGAY